MKKQAGELDKMDGTYVFLILWKTYRSLLAKADASKHRLHLGDSDFRVLEALLHKGPLPVNVIGQKVELTTGSITTAVDRLEEKWLVARRNHPEDRRVRLVELTAKGRRLIEKGYAQHVLHMEETVKCLSREERRVLVDLLKRLGMANTVTSRLRSITESELFDYSPADSAAASLPRAGGESRESPQKSGSILRGSAKERRPKREA